jgi:hypothetical protein
MRYDVIYAILLLCMLQQSDSRDFIISSNIKQ